MSRPNRGSQSPCRSRFELLRKICRDFNVEILYVFGSRAKEVKMWLEGKVDRLEPGPSDVDIGAKPSPGTHLTVGDKVLLAIALEDLFDVGRVDLVLLPEAKPFLAANIIRGERLYAEDERAADEYDLYVLRRAGDLIPLERERIKLILGVED